MNSAYTNENLEPIPLEEKKWNALNYFTLWWGMSLNIPTYMLASSLLTFGWNLIEILLSVFIGNLIILIVVLLNGHIGAKYSISFPVLARASFGIKGANFITVIRAFIACGWFGIQCWVGGLVIEHCIRTCFPMLFLKINEILSTTIISYFIFVFLNLILSYKGVRFLKKVLILHMLVFFVLTVFLIMSVAQVINFCELNTIMHSSGVNSAEKKSFFHIINSIICGFAAICVNIPDYTRFAQSSRSQCIGQIIALPFAKTYVAFIGIMVTYWYFTKVQMMIWNPINLLDYQISKAVSIILSFFIILATLISNITLNVISAANDFSNISPRLISFKKGVILTCLLSLLLQPWKIMASPNNYVAIWLSGISIGLAPIVSIMLVDYYLVNRGTIYVNALYQKQSIYWYENGIHKKAFLAFLIGVSFNIIGFLAKLYHIIELSYFIEIYNISWFSGCFISGALYYFFNKVDLKLKTSIRNTIIPNKKVTYGTNFQ